ncbi:hypothetical protein D3C72_449160 [compost metagenome]
MLHHLFLGHGHARLDHDEHLDHFTGLLVRHADGRALQHARQGRQHIFQLVGVHVEARDQDHVLLAVDDAHVAVRLNHGDVTGLQPAIAVEDLGSGLFALPVALHHLRALDAQLAHLAKRQLVAVVVDDLAQGGRHRNTDGADLVGLRRVHRSHRAGLGHAIAFADGAAGHGLPALGHAQLQGHAAGQGDLQRREVQGTERLVVAQGNEQGVEADEAAELPLAQLLDHGRQVTRVADQDVVVADQHHCHAMKGEGIDVVQRQRGDQDLATFIEVGAHQRPALQHVGHQVAVGQHRALGHAGGTTGVLQHRHVVGLRVGLGHRLALAQRQCVVEAYGTRQVVGRHHLLHVLDHAVDQQALERRQQVGHFGDDDVPDLGLGHHLLGQVGHVGQAHQGLGAGVVELVFHFPCGVQRVGVDHDQPGTHGTEYRHRVLQYVRQLHGNAVTRLEVGMLLQPGGKRPRQRIQLAISDSLAQVAKGRFVGKALAGLLEYRLDIGEFVRIDFRRNPGWVLILPKMFDHGSPLLQQQRSSIHASMRLLLI